MNRTDQVKALASENRMEILRLLLEPKKNFSDQESADPAEFGVCMILIAEKMGVAQPTASRHIELLHRAGFINIRKWQKWSYCSRNEDALRDYHRWLAATLGIAKTTKTKARAPA